MANLWTGDQPKEFKMPNLDHGVGAGQQLLLLKGVDGGLLQHALQPGAWVFNRRAEVDQLAAKAIAILPSTPLLVIVVLLIVCIIHVVVLMAKLFVVVLSVSMVISMMRMPSMFILVMILAVFYRVMMSAMVIGKMFPMMLMVTSWMGKLVVSSPPKISREEISLGASKDQQGHQPLLVKTEHVSRNANTVQNQGNRVVEKLEPSPDVSISAGGGLLTLP